VLSEIENALSRPLTDRAEAAQKETPAAGAAGGGAAAGGGDGESSWTKTILGSAGKVGAAAIAAIGGFTGFVTLAGSVVLWERFDQAGIPAEQALGKVPTGQTALFGAEAIIIAVIIAAAAVVFVFAFDSKATVSVVSVISVLVLVAIGVLFAFLEDLSFVWVLVSAVVGLVLAVACLVVADKSRTEFVPFAAAVVVATGMFNLLLFFLTTEEHIPVTPAAVVQPDGTSFTGYYVADGPDAIYLAIPTGKNDDVVFRRIPRTDDTDLGIGHTVNRDEAGPKLTEVLAQLKDQPALKPESGSAGANGPPD
jgi:hypothetical protein